MSGLETELPRPRFRTVTERETPDAPPKPDNSAAQHQVAMQTLLLALKALSQRTVVALASLFTLLTAASVFAIAYLISANPTVLQLVLLGLYGVFVLSLNIIRRP